MAVIFGFPNRGKDPLAAQPQDAPLELAAHDLPGSGRAGKRGVSAASL